MWWSEIFGWCCFPFWYCDPNATSLKAWKKATDCAIMLSPTWRSCIPKPGIMGPFLGWGLDKLGCSEPCQMLRRVLRRTAQALSCVITSCSLWQSCVGLHRSLLREKCQTDWRWMTEDHKSRLPHSSTNCSCCYYFWTFSKCCAK